MTSNGRLAKLESELSMQKSFSKLLIKSQSELDEFLHELDEDVEGMQSTILLLQQELKTKNDFIQLLEKENETLRQHNQQTNNNNNNNDNKNNNDHENKIETQKTEALDLVTETLNGAGEQIITPKIEIEDEDVANTNMTVNYNNKNIESNAAADVDVDTKDLNKCIDNNNAINDLSSLSSRHEANELNVITLNKVETTSYFNGAATENMVTAINTNEDEMNAINSRKRSHDESENKVQVIQQQPHLAYVSTPRMLPPKKSKLRVTPEEIVEQQEAFVVNMPVAEEALSLVMDKDPLAGTPNDMLAVGGCEDLTDGGIAGGIGLAAQRILTRRRSMRQQTQPNGSINMTMVGGANGNDSNDASALN